LKIKNKQELFDEAVVYLKRTKSEKLCVALLGHFDEILRYISLQDQHNETARIAAS